MKTQTEVPVWIGITDEEPMIWRAGLHQRFSQWSHNIPQNSIGACGSGVELRVEPFCARRKATRREAVMRRSKDVRVVFSSRASCRVSRRCRVALFTNG